MPTTMPEREPNLRPGALPRIAAGDRWLIRLRGASRLLGCRVLDKRPHGFWRVVLDDGLGRIEVPATYFVELLPPSDPVSNQRDLLMVELVKLRREIGRLAERVEELGGRP